jgi:hypothetical protein
LEIGAGCVITRYIKNRPLGIIQRIWIPRGDGGIGCHHLGIFEYFIYGIDGGCSNRISIYSRRITYTFVINILRHYIILAYNIMPLNCVNSVQSIKSTKISYNPVIAWYDATDTTNILNTVGAAVTNGDTISTWRDKSLNANHMVSLNNTRNTYSNTYTSIGGTVPTILTLLEVENKHIITSWSPVFFGRTINQPNHGLIYVFSAKFTFTLRKMLVFGQKVTKFFITYQNQHQSR